MATGTRSLSVLPHAPGVPGSRKVRFISLPEALNASTRFPVVDVERSSRLFRCSRPSMLSMPEGKFPAIPPTEEDRLEESGEIREAGSTAEYPRDSLSSRPRAERSVRFALEG